MIKNSKRNRIFVCYDYENDYARVKSILNHPAIQLLPLNGALTYTEWQSLQSIDAPLLKNWIIRSLADTHMTIILAGTRLSRQKYFDFVMSESISRGNAFLSLSLSDEVVDPLKYYSITAGEKQVRLSELFINHTEDESADLLKLIKDTRLLANKYISFTGNSPIYLVD